MAGERLDARDLRDRRLVQLTGGEHDRVGLELLTLGGGDAPAAALLIPPARRDGAAGSDQPLHATGLGDLAQVVVDLLLGRAQPRPVAPLGEGERIQVAGNVAGRARVAVVEPRAAEVRAALEDREPLDPMAQQLYRRGDTAEAGADDDHLQRPSRSGSRGIDGHGGGHPVSF